MYWQHFRKYEDLIVYNQERPPLWEAVVSEPPGAVRPKSLKQITGKSAMHRSCRCFSPAAEWPMAGNLSAWMPIPSVTNYT